MSPGFPRSLFTTLARLVDAEVSFDETQSGPAPGSDPFKSGDADLGWVCSTSFVDLAANGDDPSVSLVGVAWVPDDPDAHGRPVYFGDVVTLPDSGIETFEDLEGATMGCNDEVSLSGYYSLDFALDDRGLAPTYVDRVLTGGHHASLDQLLAGQLDAAVIDSVVRRTRARDDEAVASLRVIERLGPWPVQPLVARVGLPADAVDEVRQRILDAANSPEIKAELNKAGLVGLIEVDADHYSPVRQAMDRLKPGR